MRDYSRTEIVNAIDEYIVGTKYAERNRIILKLRYIDGYTYEQIAEWLYLNEDIPQSYKIGAKQISRVISEESLRLFTAMRMGANAR